MATLHYTILFAIAYEAFNMAFLQKFYLHNKKRVIVEINNHYILDLDGFPK